RDRDVGDRVLDEGGGVAGAPVAGAVLCVHVDGVRALGEAVEDRVGQGGGDAFAVAVEGGVGGAHRRAGTVGAGRGVDEVLGGGHVAERVVRGRGHGRRRVRRRRGHRRA